jgi:hypothetical protein
MDVPDLSLRSTFSPPLLLKDSPKPLLLKDSQNTSTCSMCKYTIYNLDCGHAAEDHVDPKDCPYFEKTEVPCDRDNPANRNRVSIRSEDRDGLCNKCRRRQHEIDELKAMARDDERARQQRRAEEEEKAKALKAHEDKVEEEPAKEFRRLQRKQEQKDIEYMLQKSREEADAVSLAKEQEDRAEALKASLVVEPSARNVTVEKKVSSQTCDRSIISLILAPRSLKVSIKPKVARFIGQELT